jgi:nitrogen fixation/metabolism regulation signal transduction histidine kinase
MYSIYKLKHIRANVSDQEFSLSDFVSVFTEEQDDGEGVFTKNNFMEVIKTADKQIGIVYINIFVVALLAIFFGGIITIFFPRRVTKPILSLVGAISNIREGDHSYRVENIKGTDEIVKLINSFNKMLQSIEDEYNETEKKNLELTEINETNKKLLAQTEKFNDLLEEKITEVKSELELEQKKLIENERLAAIGEIATKVAHEIRNPLSGIKVALETMKNRVEDEGRKEDIEEIIREMNRLNRIIIELFELAIPRETRFSEGQPNYMIERVLDLTIEDIKSKSIKIDKNLDHSNKIVRMDYEQMEQVLLNIILNATEAIKHAEGKILIETKYDDNKFSIIVNDNGCGISEIEKKEIFRPFFTTKNKGTGLGLAISLKIVQIHKGDISVESHKGSGAKFTITIPTNL